MKPNTITKILVCSFLIIFIFSLGACQMKSPGVQINQESKPSGEVWKASESLPVGMDAQLGEYVNIEMESDRPYTKSKEHSEEYPLNQFSNYYAEKDLHVLVPEHKAKITFQTFGEDKLLTSVLDAEDNPIRGLKEKDFVVQSGIKKAKILSVEPLEISKEVPLNIVLVVDNSYSMEERQAVESLLSALE